MRLNKNLKLCPIFVDHYIERGNIPVSLFNKGRLQNN
jgi:hypothetical protein